MMSKFIILSLVSLIGLLAWPDTEHRNGDKIEWVKLAGGCFNMGETRVYQEEGPVKKVCVKPFYIMKFEVTVANYQTFVKNTGYKTRAERGWQKDEKNGIGVELPPSSAIFNPRPDLGARNMNWWKLQEGANWRMPLGRENDYRPKPNEPVVHITREDAEAYAKWQGGRLPTEAEWEFAARGGADNQLLAWSEVKREAVKEKANTWNGIFPMVNTKEDGYAGIAPVGMFPPNGYGLYDMIGNVWEWTATPYSPSYSEADRNRAGDLGFDPTQPNVPVGTIRGGSYLCSKSYCFRYRPAARQAQDLAFGTSHIGFRIIKDIV